MHQLYYKHFQYIINNFINHMFFVSCKNLPCVMLVFHCKFPLDFYFYLSYRSSVFFLYFTLINSTLPSQHNYFVM